MLTKIILTLLVIIGAALVLRAKGGARTARPEPAGPSSLWKWLSGGLLVLVVLAGAVIWFLDWQDSRTLLEVRVQDPASGEVRSYQVYRSALQGRRFTTVDGLEIRLGDNERVEVRELPVQ